MTNNKQQTAVKWLYNELLNSEPNILEWNKLLEQAKEMDKQQMKKTASYCQKMGILVATKIPNRKTFEQWFSETYGGNK